MTERITIHLHIGAGKTGSTSIQHMLQVMATTLLQHGYLVFNERFMPYTTPKQSVCQQQTYFNNLMYQTADGKAAFARQMRRNLAYMRTHKLNHAIISAECLMNYWSDFPDYFHEFIDEVDWQIIAYVRNQPEFLLSSWKQWSHFTNTNFDNWLNTNLGTWGNWLHHLAAWENVFGTQRISLGILDKRYMVDGDLLADFVQRIGCSALSFPDELKHNVNTSPNNQALKAFEYLRDNDFIRAERRKYYENPDSGADFDEHSHALRSTMTAILPSYKNLIIRNAKHHGMHTTTSSINYYTQTQLDAIHVAYFDANRALVGRYRPDVDADLAFPKVIVNHTLHMSDSEIYRYVDQLLFEIVSTIDTRQQYLSKQVKRLQARTSDAESPAEYAQLVHRIAHLEALLENTWEQRFRRLWHRIWQRH